MKLFYWPLMLLLGLGSALAYASGGTGDLIGTDNCPFATGGGGACASLNCGQYYYYCNANNPATGSYAGSVLGQITATNDMMNAGIANPPQNDSSSFSAPAPTMPSLGAPTMNRPSSVQPAPNLGMGTPNNPAANQSPGSKIKFQ